MGEAHCSFDHSFPAGSSCSHLLLRAHIHVPVCYVYVRALVFSFSFIEATLPFFFFFCVCLRTLLPVTGYGFLPFRDWPVGAASPSEIGEEENCEEWPAHSPLANERREGMEAKRLRSSNSVGEATVVGSRPGTGTCWKVHARLWQPAYCAAASLAQPRWHGRSPSEDPPPNRSVCSERSSNKIASATGLLIEGIIRDRRAWWLSNMERQQDASLAPALNASAAR